MKTFLHITLALVALLCTTSCDGLLEKNSDLGKNENNGMKVVNLHFAPDYKTFRVNVTVPANVSAYSLTDSTKIRIKTVERSISDNDDTGNDRQPLLTHVKNIRLQELADSRLSLLLLVDLTLHEEDIRAEREAIEQIRKWFAPSNLHIAFMAHGGVSNTMPVTDYVMDNYFKQSPSTTRLYRSILEKREEVASWSQLRPEQKGIIVFSDGNVYDGDTPLDPNHYALQQEILNATNTDGYSTIDYVNICDTYADGESNEAKSIMQQLAKNTKGIYLDHFDWNKLLGDILHKFHVDYADYQLDFENPDFKVYVGKKMHLQIFVYNGSKLLTKGCAEYAIGNIYAPIIVNGLSIRQIILQGLLLTLLCFIMAYLILQILVPYISYCLFRRKYVTRYTNQNMVVGGIQVGQSCYFCKAPFEEGDEIVAKCKHVVHKECWEENEYKCPEHGRHCKDGSHYYNTHNLFDRRNAPFHTRWIFVALLAGLVAWLCFLFFVPRPSGTLLNEIMLAIYDLKPGSAEAQEAYDIYAKHLNIMPIFGLSMSLCLTFALSLLCHQQPIGLRLQWAAAKALIASLLGYTVFLLVCIVSMVLNLEDDTLLIDWTPWIVNGAIIVFISTFRTRVQLRPKFLGICAIVAIVTMLAWDWLFFDSKTDNRVLMLLCFLVYSMALAVGVAFAAPKSERYFLHVEGATKPMDIALYKWLRTSPDFEVTIGKSVDCNLQMTWDFSPIAPTQAVITTRRGMPCLSAVEEGVFLGDEPLEIDKSVRLYHGKQFTIGQTLFTYIEKDI